MFYAQSYYTLDEFWSLYDQEWYNKTRTRYGAEQAFVEMPKKVLSMTWKRELSCGDHTVGVAGKSSNRVA